MTITDHALHRLIDANVNRAGEGIRVLEEAARMLLDDSVLTSRGKELRHDLSAAIKSVPGLDCGMVLRRGSDRDVLRTGETASEHERTGIFPIIRANARRTAEALRALEEYGKVLSPGFSGTIKDIRFRLYDLEQALIARFSRSDRFPSSFPRLGILIDTGSAWVDGSLPAILGENGIELIICTSPSTPEKDHLDRLRVLTTSCDSTGLVSAIADRLDYALATGAHGVVLSYRSGLTPLDCRRAGGLNFLVGISLDEPEGRADYTDADWVQIPSGFGDASLPCLAIVRADNHPPRTEADLPAGLIVDARLSARDEAIECIRYYSKKLGSFK